MIVAVPGVRVVQMSLDEVVRMIAVRNRVVSATRTVHVLSIVPSALVRRSAASRIFRPDFDSVLINVIAMHVVHVSVVQIVGVTVVADGHVTTAGLVNMGVVRMGLVLGHGALLVSGLRRAYGPGASGVCGSNRKGVHPKST